MPRASPDGPERSDARIHGWTCSIKPSARWPRCSSRCRRLPARSVVLLVVGRSARAWAIWSTSRWSPADTYLMGGEMFSPSQLREMQAAFGQAGLEAKRRRRSRARAQRTRVEVHGRAGRGPCAARRLRRLPEQGGQPHRASCPCFAPSKTRPCASPSNRSCKTSSSTCTASRRRPCRSIRPRAMISPRQEHRHGRRDGEAQGQRAAGRRHRAGRFARWWPARWPGSSPRRSRSSISTAIAAWQAPAATQPRPDSVDDYSDYKRRQESDWQQKIGHVLEYIPGVLVSTTVSSTPKWRTRRCRSSTAVAATKTPRERRSRSVPPPTQKHIVRAGSHRAACAGLGGGAAKLLRSTCGARESNARRSLPRKPEPAAMSRRLWLAKLEKIETLVSNLLPRRASPRRARELVAVSTFQPLSINEPSAAEPEWREVALAWAHQHGGSLALAAMGLVGLLVLRSILRSPPPAPDRGRAHPPPDGRHWSIACGRRVRAAGRTAHAPCSAARFADGPVFQGELADMVRDDPNAAASVLRNLDRKCEL